MIVIQDTTARLNNCYTFYERSYSCVQLTRTYSSSMMHDCLVNYWLMRHTGSIESCSELGGREGEEVLKLLAMQGTNSIAKIILLWNDILNCGASFLLLFCFLRSYTWLYSHTVATYMRARRRENNIAQYMIHLSYTQLQPHAYLSCLCSQLIVRLIATQLARILNWFDRKML